MRRTRVVLGWSVSGDPQATAARPTDVAAAASRLTNARRLTLRVVTRAAFLRRWRRSGRLLPGADALSASERSEV